MLFRRRDWNVAGSHGFESKTPDHEKELPCQNRDPKRDRDCKAALPHDGRQSRGQLKSQRHQTRIRSHRNRRQDEDDIPTGAELLPLQAIIANLREELLVPLLPPEPAGGEDAGAVGGEQGADAVELGGEDAQDDEGEGELRQRGADVGAFEGALGGAHFDQLAGRQDDGAGAVVAESVSIRGVGLDAGC